MTPGCTASEKAELSNSQELESDNLMSLFVDLVKLFSEKYYFLV